MKHGPNMNYRLGGKVSYVLNTLFGLSGIICKLQWLGN